MELTNNKTSVQIAAKPRGPAPWLKPIAVASGYSASYLSRAINGHVTGPVLLVVKEAREKGLIPQGR